MSYSPGQTLQPEGEANSQPDDSAPSAERRQVLELARVENLKHERPPYSGVHIKTRGELAWVLTTLDHFAMDIDSRPNLREVSFRGALLWSVKLAGADLTNADLRAADLRDATLQDAILRGANLRKAILRNATLRDIDAEGANFKNASLISADLSEANLAGATLFRSHLGGANLQSADLGHANLNGAVLTATTLRYARMDSSTILRSALLSEQTKVADVQWNGAALAQVDWPKTDRLGDEAELVRPRSLPREKRVASYQRASRAYRGLAVELRAQGLAPRAARYRLRELTLERKGLLAARKPLAWLFSGFLNVVAGYGEAVHRTALVYLIAVIGFADAEYFAAQRAQGLEHPFSYWSALMYSVTAFHGRGFFPLSLSVLEQPLTVLAACEAVTGLFIEIVFIAAFTNRFFDR